jgi:hypothetical protein
LNKM